MHVVLDTQVLLRGAVAANNSLTAKIYEAWLDSRFELLLSEAILNEIERVLHERKPGSDLVMCICFTGLTAY